jgi:2-dehydro-3-deoxygalactonokinase
MPLLFSVRTLVLTGQLAAADSLQYLSGLLLGDEIRCALQADTGPGAVSRVLVGDAALCERYRRALAQFGVPSSVAEEGAAAAGLWRIACRAGLPGMA